VRTDEAAAARYQIKCHPSLFPVRAVRAYELVR
jgi:hypothetical protein